ncbi:MAG: alpha/beta fold hydrolase [Pseudomonadota bacterium]
MSGHSELLRTAGGTPVWITGTGPAVIFIHGVMVDHRMWHPQVDAMAGRYRVCCMDMLGHGGAPDPAGKRTLEEFVEQVREVVDLVSAEERPVLVGFSMGGLVAQAYAIEHHSNLAGLVLLNTVHDRSPEQAARVRSRYEANLADGVENAVRSGIGRWFTAEERRSRGELADELAGWMRDGDFTAKCKAHRVFVTSDGQLTGRLGAISCPALIATGERDAGSTPEMSRKMASAIPVAELHVLEGQHHLMTLLAGDQVNAMLLEFLPRCFP